MGKSNGNQFKFVFFRYEAGVKLIWRNVLLWLLVVMSINVAMAAVYETPANYEYEAAKQRAEQQASDNGQIKTNGLVIASQQRNRIIAASPQPMLAGIETTRWTFLGPDNIGGRIRSIAVDPNNSNNMWVGSVSGGIWKTTNGGTSWSAVDDFMGNLAVSTLVIDPSNTTTMYAGTGEGYYNIDAVRGYGVFKSTDGGNTWSQLASTIPSNNTSDNSYNWHWVNRIAVSSTGVILAATRGASGGGGIYRSTDGGASWTETYSLGRVNDVVIDPNNPNNALANAITYDSGTKLWSSVILRTTDGGQHWTTAKALTSDSFTGRTELAYAKSNASIVYASYDDGGSPGPNAGTIYKSTDGGATWSSISNPQHLDGQGWYDNAIWVSPTDPNTVLIGGIGLWRSTDGGYNWTQIGQYFVHPDQHAIVADPGYNGTSDNTVFIGNDGGIWKAGDVSTASSNSGWANLNNSIGNTQFYGGAGLASFGKIIGGTQDNGHLMTTGSLSWTLTNGGDGGFAAVDPSDGNYMYGEYVYLDIYRSTTGGGAYSYSDICNGIADGTCGGNSNALFIAPFILDPNNPNTMLAGGTSLWRSTNVKTATPAWSSIKGPLAYSPDVSAIAVAPGNSDIIWVGYNDGEVYFTTNGTAATPSWTQATGLPSRYVMSFLVDQDDNNKVYATFGGYDSDNVYVTTDGGTTWTSIHNNLPAAPVRTIVRNPSNPNWLYVGTEVGVFASENGGATWSTSNDGPANAPVDQLFWYSSDQLVAVTHGRGMFIDNVTTTPPGAPTNVSARAGNGKIIVSFTPPTNDGGTPITGYIASCSASGQPTENATGTGTPITVSGVTNGVAYSCSVAAKNSVGTSTATSAPTQVTPKVIKDMSWLMLLLD